MGACPPIHADLRRSIGGPSDAAGPVLGGTRPPAVGFSVRDRGTEQASRAPCAHTGSVGGVVDGVRALRFHDGRPVTAASAIAPLGDGWLMAQDDATFAAWRRLAPRRPGDPGPGAPAYGGRDRLTEADGTKRLTPDLEEACPTQADSEAAVLLLRSGSSARRLADATSLRIAGSSRFLVNDPR